MTKHILYVHGGEAFDSYNDYMAFLQDYPIERQLENIKSTKWNRHLDEDLGDEYVLWKPSMPSGHNAKYEEWKLWIEKTIEYVGEDEYILIGNSLGANFWTKYLTENKCSFKISQLHLIVGCFGYLGGFDLSDDLSLLESQVQALFTYHSTDDPYDPTGEHREGYIDAFPSAEHLVFEDRGHLLVPEFPELIENIKKST